MGSISCYDMDLNLEATELRLGLPGRDQPEAIPNHNPNNKRSIDHTKGEDEDSASKVTSSKAQIVGWPPIRSFRNSSVQQKNRAGAAAAEPEVSVYVKVIMDGAPYLRKIHLNSYKGYDQLLLALQSMFRITIGWYSEREGYGGSEYAPTYEDKDGDWMLVGDVPWEMFARSCKRLRIIKGSEARGLGCEV